MTKQEIVKNYREMIHRVQGHSASHLSDAQVLDLVLEGLQCCPGCGARVWERSEIEQAWAGARSSHDLTMAVGRVLTAHFAQSPCCLRKVEAEYGEACENGAV